MQQFGENYLFLHPRIKGCTKIVIKKWPVYKVGGASFFSKCLVVVIKTDEHKISFSADFY